MTLLPNEEIINVPLQELTLTNKRIRYSPSLKLVQAMPLKEVSSINVVRKEKLYYFHLSMIGAIILAAGFMMSMNDDFGFVIMMVGGTLAILFFVAYISSKLSVLTIESRGGNQIVIILKKKDIESAKTVLEQVEEAKLELENN